MKEQTKRMPPEVVNAFERPTRLPTVRDICAFAVLLIDFRYLEFSFLHMCFWRTLNAELLGGVLSRLEPFDFVRAVPINFKTTQQLLSVRFYYLLR